MLFAKTVVGACALLVVALELCSVYLVRRYSVTFARVSRQYMEAVRARPAGPGEPISVLLVGNSLLLDGVDVAQLQERTSKSLRIYPIFLEGTGYYDWLYGLHRLFRHGARPQVIVVGLETYSALDNGVWEETPALLFDARDVLGAASDMRLDHTATTGLMLSHWSAFWGMRSLFRRRILRALIPNYDDLFPFIRSDDLTLPNGQDLEAMVSARVRNLRELCEAHGAKLIIVIPPTPASENEVRQMVNASEKVGVKALAPIDTVKLAPNFYEADAIHLNAAGAVRFTSALADDLPKTVSAATNHISQ